MRDLASVFKALADETRLEMLSLLFAHGELCVCDFSGTLEINQSKASRHLQYLKHAGILSDRRAGLWVYYAVRTDLDAPRKALVANVRRVLEARDHSEVEARFRRWMAQKAKYGAVCRIPVRRTRAAAGAAKEARR
ncbi:MAG TPA: metalloregulator ArsR/SmtB family transcription factor [Polyangia bacterium]|jgi:ArsR family transcriptional regulator